MLSINESVGANSSTCARNLDLHEIQATILRPRPAPYFGTHVLLRVDDARAGREFLRRLTPHVDSAASWWNARTAWLSVGISYAGLQALGLPQDSLQSFPEAFREGMARARSPAAGRRRQRSNELATAVRHRSNPHRNKRIQRFRGKSPLRPRDGSRPVPGPVGRQRLGHAGLRRSAGRPQSFGLQRRHRPAGDRGQRRRAATGPGTADQGRRVHPRISGEAGFPLPMPQPDILGRNGAFVGVRKYQSRVGAFNRFLRANGSTEEEREFLAAKLVGRWRSGAR